MLTVCSQRKTRRARERASGLLGALSTYIEVKIRGNYKQGPVPVTVSHYFLFEYSVPWTDDAGNEIHASSKAFESAEERDAYVATHYVVLS